MRHAIALLLVLSVATAAPLPPAKKGPRVDLKAMQGDWAVVRLVIGGEAHPAADSPGRVTASVSGNRVVLRDRSHVFMDWTARLLPGGAVDLQHVNRKEGAGWDRWGIYRLDGDRLLLVLDLSESRRPKDFAGKGRDVEAYVLHRRTP